MKTNMDFQIQYMGHKIQIKRIQGESWDLVNNKLRPEQWIVAIDGDVEVLDEDFETKPKALAAAVEYVDYINDIVKGQF